MKNIPRLNDLIRRYAREVKAMSLDNKKLVYRINCRQLLEMEIE